MSRTLPINIDDLLHCRAVESARVEFKAGWDAKTTGHQTLKTICAFANDHQNLNGGYIVIGVEEREGIAQLPPAGLSAKEVKAAQKWIRGHCNRLQPTYQPVTSAETVQGRNILVVWTPGSETRPHSAPDGPSGPRRHWVRLGAETVDAEANGLLSALLEQTARTPFDDQRALQAGIADLREAKVREHLRAVGSGLLEEPDTKAVYRRMGITAPANDHDVPRNAGLLFFADDPRNWFRGAAIEVAQFAAGSAGDVQEERVFRGDLFKQLSDCQGYLEGLSAVHLQKQPDRMEARTWRSYPLIALRETLVNALYHRSYRADAVEPAKVYIFPDRVEITSYPGPMPGIELRHLQPGAATPSVPARNRRIGEFLKERQLAEGRLTGLPRVFDAMRRNGSPPPRYDFDEQRTYFRATLPAHPEYVAISAMRDAAHLRALGEAAEALRRLELAWDSHQDSAALAMELIRQYGLGDRGDEAQAIAAQFKSENPQAFAQVKDELNALCAAVDSPDHRKPRRR